MKKKDDTLSCLNFAWEIIAGYTNESRQSGNPNFNLIRLSTHWRDEYVDIRNRLDPENERTNPTQHI